MKSPGGLRCVHRIFAEGGVLEKKLVFRVTGSRDFGFDVLNTQGGVLPSTLFLLKSRDMKKET